MTNDTRVSRALQDRSQQFEPRTTLPVAYEQVLGRSSRLRRLRRARAAGGIAVGVASVLAVTTLAPTLLGLDAANGPGPAGNGSALQVQALPKAPLSDREGSAQAWVGDRLFVWGGSAAVDAGSGTSSSVFRDGAQYDPGTGQWSVIPAGPLTARMDASAVTVGSVVVVAGGRDASQMFPQAALFDPATRRWSSLPDSPNCPETAAVLDGAVYTYGGCGDGGNFAMLTDPTDPGAARWTGLPEAPMADVVQLVSFGDAVVAMNSLGEAWSYEPGKEWSQLDSIPQVAAGEAPEIAQVGGRLFAITNVEDGNETRAQIWGWSDGTWEPVARATDTDAPEGPHAVGTARAMLWGSDSGVCRYRLDSGDVDCLLSPGAGRARTTLVPDPAGRVYMWGGRTTAGHGLLSEEGVVVGAP